MGHFSPNLKARAFIAVVHVKNMINMGLDESQYKNYEYLAQFLTDLWNDSGKDRTCAVTICLSKDGCYHAHMALYGNTTTLRNVAKILFDSHVEPQLGGKKELYGYMRKIGPHEEKDEQVLYEKNLEAIQERQSTKNPIEEISDMLDKGMTPKQILGSNFYFYRFEKMIRQAYADQRIALAPRRREIHCEWHVGDTGTGKTFYYDQLCEQYGKDQIYMLTDYDNGASGGLDKYMEFGAPPILFMDEFKGEGITYGKLLVMLNEFTRMQTHSRYTNTYNLWTTCIITSIYPPEEIYEILVPKDCRTRDTFGQLLRRITTVVYHYKYGNEYKTFSIPGNEYINYKNLVDKALATAPGHDGFHKPSKEEQLNLPFTEG